MLLPDFYTIEDLQDVAEKLVATIRLNPRHTVYDGHFPEQPIVPGVIQLQIVKELMEKLTKKKLLISEMGIAKYLNLIVPDTSPLLTFEINYQKIEGQIKISTIIKEEGLVFTKIKAQLSFI